MTGAEGSEAKVLASSSHGCVSSSREAYMLCPSSVCSRTLGAACWPTPASAAAAFRVVPSSFSVTCTASGAACALTPASVPATKKHAFESCCCSLVCALAAVYLGLQVPWEHGLLAHSQPHSTAVAGRVTNKAAACIRPDEVQQWAWQAYNKKPSLPRIVLDAMPGQLEDGVCQ